METRPLVEHVTAYAAAHGLDVDVVERLALAELAMRAELDGVDASGIHTWLLTDAAARSLLESIDYGASS